jgi:transmembrane sensor
MNAPVQSDDPELERLQAAAQWLVRLGEAGDDEALIAEWLSWCEATPENFDAFERIEQTWQLAGVAAARPATQPQPVHRRGWRRYSARSMMRFAAGLAVVAVGVFLLQPQWPQGAQTLSTPVAIHGSSQLPDGSRVELGARSRISTHFDEGMRRVVIESGEAYFEVAHDKSRPFVVQAGALTVTAVGTAFNVRRGEEQVVVTVSEGRVRLASKEARAITPVRHNSHAPAATALEAGVGEQAVYSVQDGRIDLASADPAVATAWRGGVLKFVHEPLHEVVANLNRYSTREIVLAEPALGRLRYTGTVFGNRLEDWLDAVENVFPLHVSYDGPDRIVLVPNKSSSPSQSRTRERGGSEG